MLNEREKQILQLVKDGVESAAEGHPTKETGDIAEKILDIAGVEKERLLRIVEIPLYWDNQIAIRYTMELRDKEGKGYCELPLTLAAGIAKEDANMFFLDICIEEEHVSEDGNPWAENITVVSIQERISSDDR